MVPGSLEYWRAAHWRILRTMLLWPFLSAAQREARIERDQFWVRYGRDPR